MSDLKAEAENYKDTLEKLETTKPKEVHISLIGGSHQCGTVKYEPINDRLEIYDYRGSNPVSFTASEGEKLLAALKELLE
jgi:hypothetical protein